MWKFWWLRSRRIVGWSTWTTTSTGICREHPLSDDRPKREIMSIEEATISNMWEVAAIAESPQDYPPPKYFLRVFRHTPRAAILLTERTCTG